MDNGFNGFPPGRTPTFIVPSLFISDLLPLIDNLPELKLTIYCMWALQQQEGQYRYLRFTEVLEDETLLTSPYTQNP